MKALLPLTWLSPIHSQIPPSKLTTCFMRAGILFLLFFFLIQYFETPPPLPPICSYKEKDNLNPKRVEFEFTVYQYIYILSISVYSHYNSMKMIRVFNITQHCLLAYMKCILWILEDQPPPSCVLDSIGHRHARSQEGCDVCVWCVELRWERLRMGSGLKERLIWVSKKDKHSALSELLRRHIDIRHTHTHSEVQVALSSFNKRVSKTCSNIKLAIRWWMRSWNRQLAGNFFPCLFSQNLKDLS